MLSLTTIASTGQEQSSFVLDLLAILATAALVAILLARVRLAVIPAYLVAGALVGPNALRLVRSDDSLQTISQLAIVLLLFGIGLHLHLSALGKHAVRLVTAGALSCTVSIIIGWPVARAFGLDEPQTLVICMALSLSSTAVVLRLIVERGELRHVTGQLALAILVVQDLLVIGMLAALPAIARWNQGLAPLPPEGGEVGDLPGWGRFIVQAGLRVGGMALLIVTGRLILTRVLTEAAREKTGEILMIASVAAAIGAGVATQLIGFSMELGAFLAGFLLASTPFRHHLSGQIAPLRDLFMAVFFTTLGMQLDPKTLLEWWWVILVGGAVMSAIKAIAIGGTCYALGATAGIASAVGLGLAQAGEFSLVLIDQSVQQILSAEVAANVIAIVVISLIITPVMVDVGARLSRGLERMGAAPWIHAPLATPPPSHQLDEGRLHVIVGGYGYVGNSIVSALEQANVRCTVIEIRPPTAQREKATGREILLGDVANAGVLDSAGLETAAALILTMPDEHAVLSACAIARRRNRHIYIAARIGVTGQRQTASELGADEVIVEEVETARALKEVVLRKLRVAPSNPKQ